MCSPLFRRDIELTRILNRYTPDVALLLTEVNTLDEEERAQVKDFVHGSLGRHWDGPVPVLPSSIRPGFEHLRVKLDPDPLSPLGAQAGEKRARILRHKQD